jgi:diguanylate cyclase (GGDEF)-like protein
MKAQVEFSILLVDDDPVVIRALSRILNEFAPLRYATSGRAALKLAREVVPDLVLLDVEMPDLSGFDVCKAFKSDQALAHVPIVFITSYDSAELEASGLELGASDFIQKPPHAPLVLARVRTYQRLKMLSDTLRNIPKIDFLTGAVNRRQMEELLALQALRVTRDSGLLALLFAEIDGFSEYNAQFGEAAGDLCLRAVADALRSAANQPAHILGRWSGTKFAILLPETSASEVTRIAQRAIDAVDELHLSYSAANGVERRIALTVGGSQGDVSNFTPANPIAELATQPSSEGGAARALIAGAEKALSSGKSAGGHQVRIDIASLELVYGAVTKCDPRRETLSYR